VTAGASSRRRGRSARSSLNDGQARDASRLSQVLQIDVHIVLGISRGIGGDTVQRHSGGGSRRGTAGTQVGRVSLPDVHHDEDDYDDVVGVDRDRSDGAQGLRDRDLDLE